MFEEEEVMTDPSLSISDSSPWMKEESTETLWFWSGVETDHDVVVNSEWSPDYLGLSDAPAYDATGPFSVLDEELPRIYDAARPFSSVPDEELALEDALGMFDLWGGYGPSAFHEDTGHHLERKG